MHLLELMRALAAALVVLPLLTPAGAAAQSRLAQPAPAATRFERPEVRPVVSVAPVALADEDEDSMVAMQRAGERIADRLRPLQQRLQEDDRLRRAGAVVGLGAVAIGALRGTAPLTFAGTQAIRFGLRNQLATIERHSGLVVQPAIGHRSVSITVNKTFR